MGMKPMPGWVKGSVAALLLVATMGLSQRLKQPIVRSGSTAPAAVKTQPDIVPPMSLGIGLGSGDYWTAEWRITDPVQNSGTLVRVDENGQWAVLGDHIQTDATGHPVSVPKGTTLVAIIAQGAPRLQQGRFACRVSPGWEVSLFGDAQISGSGPKFNVTVPSAVPRNGWSIVLKAKADNNRLGELSCTPEGGDGSRYGRAFLSDVKPFAVLRFMDLMRTNNAPARIWARRATPASLSQSGPEGMSVEDMVGIANAAGTDAWFNMPLDTDPDYYRQFAIYVRDHLAPGHRAYVELSNEVWNGEFTQGKLAVARGKQQYPGVDDFTAADLYYADRVRALMAIWSEVFRGQEKRLVRVLSSQSVWPQRAERALAHKDTWRSVDALATAPYFGEDGGAVQASGPARVDALFQRGPMIVDQTIRQAKASKQVARRYGLRFITYEGGAGYSAYRTDTQADLLAMNRDPRFRDLYLLYLRRWKAEIGDLLMVFVTVGTPGPGGYWGHKDYTGQPVSEAPKMAALYDFLGYKQQLSAQ